MKNINFDHNAIEMPLKNVLKSLRKIYKNGYSNPHALYKDGRTSLKVIDDARQKVSAALGCDADEIIFTSCASESNSLVQCNYLLDVDSRSHHSIQRMPDLPKGNLTAMPLIVSETGELLLDEIASNPTKEYFIDLTQAIGKIKINLHDLPNVMFASASGQKFGGIQGAGILYINKKWKKKIKPLIYGSQENGLRGGTINLPAVFCFGEAIKYVTDKKNMRKHNHRNNQVLNIIEDGIKNKNIKYKRNTNVINITFNTLNASTVVELFDKYGINISGGSACMSGSEKPADSFLKSGYTYDEAMRTIRISVGFTNKRRHAKKFLKIFNYIIDNYDC